MFKLFAIILIYLQCFFYLAFFYKLKINLYGSVNLAQKSASGLNTVSAFVFLKKIFDSKIVEKFSLRMRNNHVVDVFIFERVPFANLCTKSSCHIIDKSGATIIEGIDPSKICIFVSGYYDINTVLSQLKSRFVRNCDYLLLKSASIYEVSFDDNKLIYYNGVKIDKVYEDLKDKLKENKFKFTAEFVSNEKFYIFFRKGY